MKPGYLVVFGILVAGLVGCGSAGKANVKGKVTFDGKTVKYGDVIVYGSDGKSQKSPIDREGFFEVKDVASGECKVAVVSLNPKDVPSPDREAKGPDPIDLKNWFAIPTRFADIEKSGLKMTLKPGNNEQELAMTK